MKKNMKRTLSAIMATAMLASCAGVATLAANAAFEITIEHGEGVIEADTHDHEYEAYRIFRGTVSDTGILTNIEWGNGVSNSTTLLATLKDTGFGSNSAKVFASAETASDVAKIISDNDLFYDHSAAMIKLSRIFADYLNDDNKAVTNNSNKITLSAPGYYLIQDAEGSPTPNDETDSTNYAKTAYIMQVIDKAVTITAKADTPTITKKIMEGTQPKDFNTASIGDTITYQFNTAVPKMEGYTKYYFVIYDTMDEGITFNPNSVEIKLGNDTLPETNYTVTTGEAADNTDTADVTENIKIVFKNFKQYEEKAETPIIVNYTGTLNENAKIGSNGNENTVYLQYSNNPNSQGTGKPGNPDEPGPDDNDIVGTTPEDKVVTYTTALKIKKVDETHNALDGAIFTITGTNLKSTAVVTKGKFVENQNGTYYKLKDGTYTQTDPTTLTDTSKYASTTKYALTYVTTNEDTDTVSNGKITAVVTDGYLYLKGLNTGKYTITETKAPSGYNSVDEITINIEAKPTATGCTWSDTSEQIKFDSDDNAFVYEVVNMKGSLLPSTGGIGTTIFYAGGTFLLLGAAGLFINKRRKGEESE